MSDEADVLAAIEARIDAMRRKDAAAANAVLAPDIVAFEIGGPLQIPAAMATATGHFQTWLDGWEWIDVEMRDVEVAVSGDVAFVHSFNRLHGVQAGKPFDMWARSTLGLRKIDGRWLITHGHTSVPFAMDGSFRAQVDLKP